MDTEPRLSNEGEHHPDPAGTQPGNLEGVTTGAQIVLSDEQIALGLTRSLSGRTTLSKSDRDDLDTARGMRDGQREPGSFRPL